MRLTFEISDDAYNLLIRMKGRAFEYRDIEYSTKEDFMSSVEFEGNGGIRNLEWFLNRNMGGTYHLIQELSENGLVESDGISWHSTYVVTDFGNKFV